MYRIKATLLDTGQEMWIYRDNVVDKALKLNSPKLELVENSAGSLTFKMPPNNVGYDYMNRMTTILDVYKDDSIIWSGRIISMKEDFQKNKSITAEGVLAYLNDTIQPQKAYNDILIGDLLQRLLIIHNERVEEPKKLYFGDFEYAQNWDYNTYTEVYTNYETTLKAVVEKVINISNGYIEIRNINGSNYIFHTPYSDRPICNQTIEFGKNLLDFTKSFDADSLCTVVLPLGEPINSDYGFSTSGIEGVQAYTTIETINNGSPYVVNQDAVDSYGWIEQTVNFDGITNKQELKQFAENWLSDVQYDQMTLEVSAVDLNCLNADYEQMKLSQYVHVVSRPHGLDRYFPITKISIPMDNPSGTTFTMGVATSTSISSRTIKQISAAEDKIREIPTVENVLYNARIDAGNLVSGFSTGYVTITQRNNGSNELYVTEKQIPKDFNADNPTSIDVNGSEILKYWRWNANGLEYVNKTKNRQHNPVLPDNTPLLALDMEGRINASMILTGSLTANVITAGILKNSGWGNGSNIFYLDLENGILKMNATELKIAGSTVESIATNSASTAANRAINNMSQETVFNKLTNNGQIQGLYMENGQMYINATYLSTGLIRSENYGKARVLSIRFSSDSTLENEFDFIQIYGYDESIKKYRATSKITGSGIANLWLMIPFSDFYIYFQTDSSVEQYGWRISEIDYYDCDKSQVYWHMPNIVDTLPNYSTSRTYTGTGTLPESAHPYASNTKMRIRWRTNKEISLGDNKGFYFDLNNGNIDMRLSDGSYWNNDEGIHIASGSISIGTKFNVTTEGVLTGVDAKLVGSVTSGRVESGDFTNGVLKISNGWINFYANDEDADNDDYRSDSANFLYRIRPSGYGSTKYESGIEFVGHYFLMDCDILQIKNQMLGAYYEAVKSYNSNGWRFVNGICIDTGDTVHGETREVGYKDEYGNEHRMFFNNGLMTSWL